LDGRHFRDDERGQASFAAGYLHDGDLYLIRQLAVDLTTGEYQNDQRSKPSDRQGLLIRWCKIDYLNSGVLMVTGQEGGTAAELSRNVERVQESGFEKRGGYAATQISTQLPRAEPGPAPRAAIGGQESHTRAQGDQAQSGAS
jgi:hypothetical protein